MKSEQTNVIGAIERTNTLRCGNTIKKEKCSAKTNKKRLLERVDIVE